MARRCGDDRRRRVVETDRQPPPIGSTAAENRPTRPLGKTAQPALRDGGPDRVQPNDPPPVCGTIPTKAGEACVRRHRLFGDLHPPHLLAMRACAGHTDFWPRGTCGWDGSRGESFNRALCNGRSTVEDSLHDELCNAPPRLQCETPRGGLFHGMLCRGLLTKTSMARVESNR